MEGLWAKGLLGRPGAGRICCGVGLPVSAAGLTADGIDPGIMDGNLHILYRILLLFLRISAIIYRCDR